VKAFFLIGGITLAAALFTILLGLVVLCARPRAVNFAAAGLLVFRGASDFGYQMMRQSESVGEATGWLRLAQGCEIPALAAGALLLYLLLSKRGPLARLGLALLLALSLLGAYAFAVGSPSYSAGVRFSTGIGGVPIYGAATAPLGRVYQAGTWLLEGAAILLAGLALRAPERPPEERRRIALFGVAFGIPLGHVILLWLGAVTRDLARGVSSASTEGGLEWKIQLIMGSAFGLCALAWGLPILLRVFQPRTRKLLVALFAASLVAAVFDDAFYLLFQRGMPMPAGYMNSRVVWVTASAVCLALAFVRHDLLKLGPGTHRRVRIAARAALLAVFLGLPVALLLAIQGGSSWPFVALFALALAALTLTAPPVGALTDAARRLLRDDAAPILGLAPLPERFRVERQLAQGPFATVLLASDTQTRSRVVLKRLRSEGAREASALRAMRHPRIVPLLDTVQVGDDTVLVLGHMPGGDVATLLDARGPLPPARAVDLALDALDALGAMHAAGLAHGDVKPANVLLDAHGRGVLADLGATHKLQHVSETLTSSLGAGTYATLSPERLRGARASVASDVYAVGALLYRMLTGEDYVDLEGKTALQASETILHDAPRLPHPRVPSPLARVLAKALEKDPDARYASAESMRDALRGAA